MTWGGFGPPLFAMTYKTREIVVDPYLGLQTEFLEDEDGNVGAKYRQDAAPVFEQVLRARNDGVAWQKGMKNNMVHALSIPAGVVMELFSIGINVYQAPTPDIVAGLKKLNRYEACDVTGKKLVKASHK